MHLKTYHLVINCHRFATLELYQTLFKLFSYAHLPASTLVELLLRNELRVTSKFTYCSKFLYQQQCGLYLNALTLVQLVQFKKGESVHIYLVKMSGDGLNVMMAVILLAGEMAGLGVLALPHSMIGTGPAGFFLIIYFTFNAIFVGQRLGLCWTMIERMFPEYREEVRFEAKAEEKR